MYLKCDCLFHLINAEQSGDENIPPISPYEETFFFRHLENTKVCKNVHCMSMQMRYNNRIPVNNSFFLHKL